MLSFCFPRVKQVVKGEEIAKNLAMRTTSVMCPSIYMSRMLAAENVHAIRYGANLNLYMPDWPEFVANAARHFRFLPGVASVVMDQLACIDTSSIRFCEKLNMVENNPDRFINTLRYDEW